MLPRAIGADTVDPAGRETLTVLSSNIYVGRADPGGAGRSGRPLRLRPAQRPGADAGIRPRAAPRRARPAPALRDRARSARARPGGGLYSRLPLRELPGSPSFFRHAARRLRLPDGRRVRVVDVHPLTPGRSGNDDLWEDSLETCRRQAAAPPWVLIGDFNATLDVSLLRETIDRGYRDAGDVAGEGLVPTWPNAGHTLPPFITIDHVLADARLGIVDYGVEDLPGSDHRSIHAELALP